MRFTLHTNSDDLKASNLYVSATLGLYKPKVPFENIKGLLVTPVIII